MTIELDIVHYVDRRGSKMPAECEKCGNHTLQYQCKTALHVDYIINGCEFSRIYDHVELIKELDVDNDYINAFYDGYICCFDAVIKALEKDLE